MASQMPRHVMRNATLFVNRDSQIGQASEIGFPELKRKMADVWNAGQEVEIEIAMGYEKIATEFQMTGFLPEVLVLFGLAVGVETEFMATAANVDEQTGETHSMVAYIRGILTEVKADKAKRGDLTKTDYKVSFRYYKLEIDGQPIYEIDPFRVVIGGVDQTAASRKAMMI